MGAGIPCNQIYATHTWSGQLEAICLKALCEMLEALCLKGMCLYVATSVDAACYNFDNCFPPITLSVIVAVMKGNLHLHIGNQRGKHKVLS